MKDDEPAPRCRAFPDPVGELDRSGSRWPHARHVVVQGHVEPVEATVADELYCVWMLYPNHLTGQYLKKPLEGFAVERVATCQCDNTHLAPHGSVSFPDLCCC